MKRPCLLLLMLLPLPILVGCTVSKYTCPASDPPCYGVVEIPSAGIQGFGVFVDLVKLTTGDGSIGQLIRILDSDNKSCKGNQCWIEVGYAHGPVRGAQGTPPSAHNPTVGGVGAGSGGGAGGPSVDPGPNTQPAPSNSPPSPAYFYWIDNGPDNGGRFIFHNLGAIPDTYYGKQKGGLLSGQQKVFLLILKTTAKTWNVSVFPVGIAGAPAPSGTINNSMNARSALMGQELTGTFGSSAPAATFTFAGIKPAGSTSQVLTIVTTDGITRSDNPPTANWLTAPSVSGASGGTFQTKCCLK